MTMEVSDGFVTANKIDLKTMDEQLERFLNRGSTVQKDETPKARVTTKDEWEIDISKLLVKKGPIVQGTFGSVHRGVYHGQAVAVKLLDWGEDDERTTNKVASLRTAFMQEVSVWHKLDHPNVTKFIGAIRGTSGSNIQIRKRPLFQFIGAIRCTLGLKNSNNIGIPSKVSCVVAEYISGGTLKSHLIKHYKRKLAFKDVHQLALDIARGLSYLHSKKIVHRDIKTENMLLDKSGKIKIIDFGVAQIEASNPSDMTGMFGTLGYMAPEVINGNPYNRKCDVYSFGICLWEIYCCDMPYANSRNFSELRAAIENAYAKSRSFSELTAALVAKNERPDIPECCPSSLANLMKRCWDADPNKRPEMKEVVSMLEAMDTSKGGGMIPVDQLLRPKRAGN